MSMKKKGSILLLLSLLFFILSSFNVLDNFDFIGGNLSFEWSPIELSDWLPSFLLSNIVLLFVTFTLLIVIRKKLGFDLLAYKKKPTTKNLILSFAIVAIVIVLSLIIYQSPIYYAMVNKLYGRTYTVILILSNLIGSFVANILFIAFIGFSQQGFELVFQNHKIPFVSFFLIAISVISALISHNWLVEIFNIILSVAVGVIYLLCAKNTKYYYWFSLLLFMF